MTTPAASSPASLADTEIPVEPRRRVAGLSIELPTWLADIVEEGEPPPHERYVVFRGERIRLATAARRAGLSPGALRWRLTYLGWDVERAMTTPCVVRRPPKGSGQRLPTVGPAAGEVGGPDGREREAAEAR